MQRAVAVAAEIETATNAIETEIETETAAVTNAETTVAVAIAIEKFLVFSVFHLKKLGGIIISTSVVSRVESCIKLTTKPQQRIVARVTTLSTFNSL